MCKQVASNLVNGSGNVSRKGMVPKFSDLKAVALNITSEVTGIGSEILLLAKLEEYRSEIPNLISRNNTITDVKLLRLYEVGFGKRMAAEIDRGKDYFCMDSKLIKKIYRFVYSWCFHKGKKDFEKAPSIGFCR